MTPTSHPLTWPHGWPRTKPETRKRAPFHGHSHDRNSGRPYPRDLTVSEGYNRLEDELRRIGARSIVLSTNLRLRNDGLPYSGQPDPHDPGAAVYFKLSGKDHVLAVDNWDRCADNIAALAKTVEAMRGIERWGVGNLEQRFSGYKALPAATCWSVLQVPDGADPATIETSFKELAKIHHPDRGGSAEEFIKLTTARKEALDFCVNGASA